MNLRSYSTNAIREARRLLRRARTLIADERAWTTGAFARDRRGNTIAPDSTRPTPVAWCMAGALFQSEAALFGTRVALVREERRTVIRGPHRRRLELAYDLLVIASWDWIVLPVLAKREAEASGKQPDASSASRQTVLPLEAHPAWTELLALANDLARSHALVLETFDSVDALLTAELQRRTAERRRGEVA